MKRLCYRGTFWAVFALGFFVFFSAGVSAQACTDSQTILKLSASGNAHGEVWDWAGNYPERVCYDQIFGSAYTGANPHACNGNNLVLKLDDLTNAHAEIETGSNYGTQVCYGDLSCIGRTGSCVSGETEVVSLSGATNAHLEKANVNVFTNPYRICCSVGTAPPSGQFFWAVWQDLYGNNISKTNVGQSVVLLVKTNFPQGTNVVFDIWERDFFPNPDDPIGQLTGVVDANGFAQTLGVITPTLMQLGGAGLEPDPLEFYYIASAGSASIESYRLNVYNNPGPNLPPIPIITSPVHRGIYYSGTQINFEHASVDPEAQPLTVDWLVFHNGVIEFTMNNAPQSFQHTFNSDGMRTIILRVTDAGGLISETQIAIVIVSSPGMISFINEPFYWQIVKNPGSPPTVGFDASDSFIVNSVGSACPIVTCIAGNCPLQTQNVPLSCTGQNNIPVSGAPLNDFSNLNFGWSFLENGMLLDNFGGLGQVSGAYSYTNPSNSRNDKTALLTLSYSGSATTINPEFTGVFFTLGQCISGGTQFLKTYGEGYYHSTLNTLNSGLACSGGDGIINGNECCPVGFACNIGSGNNPGGCFASPNNIVQCEDYQTSNDCENDDFNVGNVNNPVYSSLVNSCTQTGGAANIYCVWDNANSQCTPHLDCTNPSCTGSGCVPLVVSSCDYTAEESECVAGYLTITYNQNPVNPACPNQDPVTVPCSLFNLELGFFDYKNFAYAFLLIVVIYFILGIKKRYGQ